MPTYEQAIAALQSIKSVKSGDVDKVSALMIGACRRAVAWKPDLDPYKIQREEDRLFLEFGLPSMAATVAKLQGLANQHERAFDAVVWRAVKAAGLAPDMLREAGYDSSAGGQCGRFLRALLASLHDQLKAEKRPDTRVVKGKRSGGMQRHIHGPLC